MELLKELSVIKNQDGEAVLESGIERSESGALYRFDLVCYSTSGLGLGTCLCQSHDPYRSRPLSVEECDTLPEEWYHIFCGPGRDQVVLQKDCPCHSDPDFRGEELAKLTPQMAWVLSTIDPDRRWVAANTSPVSDEGWRFNQRLALLGLTLKDIETFCELSYRLDSNPLSKLRRTFPGIAVNFMHQDQERRSSWSHDYDHDDPEIVVELCDMRDSDGYLRVWIETYF